MPKNLDRYSAEISAAAAAYQRDLAVAADRREQARAVLDTAYNQAVRMAELRYEAARGTAASDYLDAEFPNDDDPSF